MEAFPVFAAGKNFFACIVCGEMKARFGLQVSAKTYAPETYALCSTKECIQHDKRDSLFSSALPRGINACDPAISYEWANVVQAAWYSATETKPPPNTPMQFIDASSSPDRSSRFDIGLLLKKPRR